MNPRIILFVSLLLVPISVLAYVAYDATRSSGIRITDDGIIVSLRAMSTFPFDQQVGQLENVPTKWRDLDGETITLVGQMWAPDKFRGPVDEFDLVYSISECCFVGEPQIQHFVQASAPPELEVRLYGKDDFIQVTGKLRVEVTRDDTGRITGVYHLDVATVEPIS